MNSPDTPFLDTQKGFVKLWRRTGLHLVAPLTFDEPNQTTVPPYAAGVVRRNGQIRSNCGETIQLLIRVDIRLPMGSRLRETVERALGMIVRQEREYKLTGAVLLRNSDASVDRDTSRFGGVGVELQPYTWEMWRWSDN
jgi:hypothetical protein